VVNSFEKRIIGEEQYFVEIIVTCYVLYKANYCKVFGGDRYTITHLGAIVYFIELNDLVNRQRPYTTFSLCTILHLNQILRPIKYSL